MWIHVIFLLLFNYAQSLDERQDERYIGFFNIVKFPVNILSLYKYTYFRWYYLLFLSINNYFDFRMLFVMLGEPEMALAIQLPNAQKGWLWA